MFDDWNDITVDSVEYDNLKESDKCLSFLLSERGALWFYWQQEHGLKVTKESILNLIKDVHHTK